MRLFASLALASIACLSQAKVGNISFERLVSLSDAIVVGKVTRVDKIGGVLVATADVILNVRGSRRQVRFLAQRTMKCDTTDAKTGETALLCLSIPGKDHPDIGAARRAVADLFVLTYLGRGRMPLVARGNGWMARVVRYGPREPWQLGASLFAPKIRPLVSEKDKGLMSLDSLIRAARAKTAQTPDN